MRPALRLELERRKDWLRGVRRVYSPNCDDRPPGCAIDLLVVHGVSLPPGDFGGPHIDELFTNRLNPEAHPYFRSLQGLRVSAHVLISRDGKLTQYVPLRRRAWHAGPSLFEGRAACNDFSIGIELEGTDDSVYEPVQYERLADLCRLFMTEWPAITRERIVGHCTIAPERKTDPGRRFDWDHLFRLLAAPGR